MMPFIGIDVSKDMLDIYNTHTSLFEQVRNTPESIEVWVETLLKHAPTKLVLEATGGYEQTAFQRLRQAGLPVVCENPRRIRDFAKACGILAKTDRLDAKVLALYAQTIAPEPREYVPSPELTELLRRKRQLVEARTKDKIQLKQTSDSFVIQDIQDALDHAGKRLKALEVEIERRIQQDESLSKKHKQLQAVPGIGIGTSQLLLGALPELGHVSGKEIASLVGVAPKNRDSGQMRGQRFCWGGRAFVRAGLYMAVLSSVRYFTPVREFYERLKTNGKASKVALMACMRKLLVILNARMRDHLAT
jgi:transposase